MSQVAQILLADSKQYLLEKITNRAGLSCADEAMLCWLLGPEVARVQFKTLLRAVDKDKRLEEYQTLACAGFAASANELPEELGSLLHSAVSYQSSRDPFSGTTPMRFCSDGVALLGIVLASNSVGDPELTVRLHGWLARFLPRTVCSQSHSDWELGILHAVNVTAGGGTDTGGIPSRVKLALQGKGFLPIDSVERQSDLYTAVLKSAKENNFVDTPIVENALMLASLNSALSSGSIDLSQPSVADLVLILAAVPSSLKRWVWEDKPRTTRSFARKWHIDHEYHVQALLYTILAPLFPDIREEDNLPSVGQKNPRVDLFIPSLQVIVEVKFLRKTTKFQDAIGEISEDCGLYRAHRRELTIVPFIWDAGRRTDQHSVARRGLMELDGVCEAVIVPAPGWLEPESTP